MWFCTAQLQLLLRHVLCHSPRLPGGWDGERFWSGAGVGLGVAIATAHPRLLLDCSLSLFWAARWVGW